MTSRALSIAAPVTYTQAPLPYLQLVTSSFTHPLLNAFKQAEYGELLLVTPDSRSITFRGSKLAM